jgi:hypothetical protein
LAGAVLDGMRAQLMEKPPHRHAPIGVRVESTAPGHQRAGGSAGAFAQFGVIVGRIPEQEAPRCGQMLHAPERFLIVRPVGRRAFGRLGQLDAGHRGNQLELSAMPARFCPAGLGVNARGGTMPA